MTPLDLGAHASTLARKYGDDAAQEAVLALLRRSTSPNNVGGFLHRVAYLNSDQVVARRGSHRPGAPRREYVEVSDATLKVEAVQLRRAEARQELERLGVNLMDECNPEAP